MTKKRTLKDTLKELATAIDSVEQAKDDAAGICDKIGKEEYLFTINNALEYLLDAKLIVEEVIDEGGGDNED